MRPTLSNYYFSLSVISIRRTIVCKFIFPEMPLFSMAAAVFVFEACVNSLQSALQAEKGGAGRLELCSALSQGGITPSYGLIKTVKEHVKIPVHVLIRPRAGDFCYTETEVKVICEDIHMVGRLGVQGIAFGALTATGDIDLQLMQLVIDLCKEYGLSITFHRAFDATGDAAKALQVLIELGIPRVLTSGQRATVDEGMSTLKMLVEQSANRISIMPGGGVTESNAAHIVRTLGVTELHSSARSPIVSGMSFANGRIRHAMTGGEVQMATDWEKIDKIVKTCADVSQQT